MTAPTSRSNGSDADEVEPLLGVRQRKETPLPKVQLFTLCAVRLAEPIAYTQIFPWVNKMMEWLHVTDQPSRIGFYSGLVESAFAFAQLLFIFQWASLSDRIGRKPVILCGLAGSALSTLLFGLAGSLPAALAARMLAGGLAGNVAVIQSMVGELTDETNQARAFPILSLCWNLGCIIGPMIGGTFYEPATRYPEIFGHIQILRDRPYLLPCAVSSFVTLCAIVAGYFLIEETLPSKVKKQNLIDSAQSRSYGTVAPQVAGAPAVVEPAPSMRKLLKDPVIISVVRSYFLLSITGSGIEVLFVLMAYTAISLGGLGRSPAEIGLALSSSGLLAAVMSPLLFPYLAARIPVKRLYPILMSFYPVAFLTLPLLNIIARIYRVPGTEAELTKRGTVVLWTALAVPLIITRIAHMCYATNMIFLKHAAPSRASLGRTFGIGQTVAAVARGISPALASSLFALTTDYNLLGGWFVWIFMATVGVIGAFTARTVKDGVEEREKLKAQQALQD